MNSGGLSNWLYHIWLPESLQEKENTNTGPNQVLIRVYGQMHGERAIESLITESVIFTLLSERGLGPRLHGVFPGGRIEEYIAARPLKTKELSEPKLSTRIAMKMAEVHKMEVPLSKEPKWLWDTIQRWQVTCQRKLNTDKVPSVAQSLKSLDLGAEMNWLRRTIDLQPSNPVVFCHNDFQEGNILLMENSNDNDNNNHHQHCADDDIKLVLIDFEYCSYNYRGFDIANHLLEWSYDYSEASFPYYRENLENYPTNTQQVQFLRNYLLEMNSTEKPQNVMAEIRIFTLASHLFWGLWSIVNAGSSQIPFGYWEYAMSRLGAYKRMKSEFLAAPHKRKLDEMQQSNPKHVYD